MRRGDGRGQSYEGDPPLVLVHLSSILTTAPHPAPPTQSYPQGSHGQAHTGADSPRPLPIPILPPVIIPDEHHRQSSSLLPSLAQLTPAYTVGITLRALQDPGGTAEDSPTVAPESPARVG
jgi:hypothetical protein